MTRGSAGVPYKQFRAQGPFDVIVIGSGIGGLATAALLAKAAGQRVLVLERHYTAGGCTQVFHRPGFEWDVGVHYVGQVHDPRSAAHAMFEYLAEGRLEWQAMPDVYDRVIVDGLRFDYVRGEARLRDALIRAFPAETRAIDDYFQAIRRCLSTMPLYFVEKTLSRGVDRIIGTPLRAPFLHYARRTTSAMLHSLGATPALAAILTAQWPNYGLPPDQSSFGRHAIVASHYFDGGAYPVGGASRIASSLIPTIERAGGVVVVDATVEKIVIENEAAVGVRMQDGREFRAWTVVSDAGVQGTLRHLLPDKAPAAARELAARVSGLQPSLAHLCLYRYVPAVQGAVVSTELSTPLSTRHVLGNQRGEIYGVAHSPARFESRDLRPQTPLRGLYLTGQDVGTGGVMGAISGAVAAASAMLRRNLFSEMSKAA